MDMSAYIDEIRLKLTGSVLDLELDDETLQRVVNSAFREIQRYIDTTKIATIPYSKCIDLSDCGVSSVVRIYRANVYMGTESSSPSNQIDPMYASQWQILAGNGSGYNISEWIYNYSAWNTMKQIRNTISTDLAFKYDKHTNRLYINVAYNEPKFITIEYIPRYNDVSEIISDYWIDMLIRLAVALTKVTVGRIRTRFTQSNALWTQDGELILEEGNTELAELRQHLMENSQLVYPID